MQAFSTYSIPARSAIFAPIGEGIELVYLNRDNQQSTVLRCTAG